MTDTSSYSSGENSRQTAISAFFDTREEAEDAVERLRDIGVLDADIRMTEGAEDAGQREEQGRGFWAALGDLFFPDEDRAVYAEGLARGGFLVVVSGLDDDTYDQALDILDDEGAVDIEERSASWREEGWTGTYGSQGVAYEGGAAAGAVSDYQGSAAGYGGSGSGSVAGGPGTGMIGGAEGLSGSEASTSSASDEGIWDETGEQSRRAGAGEDEVLPVVEERLRVGKRDTSHGRVRVRSYTVEEPVTESVRLRQDRVEVEHRLVDRPVTEGDDAFRDRTIEAEEHGEEAVVAKEARVVGEVGLRRTSDTRQEKVSDTVRRTRVEMEDARTMGRSDRDRGQGGTGAPASAGTAGPSGTGPNDIDDDDDPTRP